MRILNMNEVRGFRARNLAGQACVGRGSFASVFAASGDASSVTKVTADDLGYYFIADRLFLEQRAAVERHFPALVEDFGDVGTSRGFTVYAAEIERLVPVASIEHKRFINALYAELMAIEPNLTRQVRHSEMLHFRSLELCARKQAEPGPYQGVFEALWFFLANYGGALDLKVSNFMIRPSDTTLVWNDVVFNATTFYDKCVVH